MNAADHAIKGPRAYLACAERERRIAVNLFCAALIGGAALRFWRLTHESLWLDEIYTVWVTQHSLPEIWRLMRQENFPPLYYLMLRAWFFLVGRSDYTARAFSACCGVLLIALAGWIGWRRNPLVGALAAVFAAVLPPLVRYGQETRMYALLALLAAVAVAGALLRVERPESRGADRLYACGITLACATHYYALFLWAGLVFGMLLTAPERGRQLYLRLLRDNLLPGLALLLWLPMLAEQWRQNAQSHWLLGQPQPDALQPLMFIAWCFGWYDEKAGFGPGWNLLSQRGPALLSGFLAVIVMGTIALNLRHKHHDDASASLLRADESARILLACSVAFPVLLAWSISQYKMIWQIKYLLTAVPGLLGLAIAGLVKLRHAPATFFVVGVLLLTSSLCSSLSRTGTMAPWNQEEWREAARQLRGELRPGDLIVAPEPVTLPPIWVCLEYYGVPRRYLIGVRYDLSRPQDRTAVQRVEREAHRIWLVTRFGLSGAAGEAIQRMPGFIPGCTFEYRGVTLQLYTRTLSAIVSPSEGLPQGGLP